MTQNKDCKKKKNHPKCQREDQLNYRGVHIIQHSEEIFFKNSRCPRHVIMKTQVKNTSCGTVPGTQVYSGG